MLYVKFDRHVLLLFGCTTWLSLHQYKSIIVEAHLVSVIRNQLFVIRRLEWKKEKFSRRQSIESNLYFFFLSL